MFITRGRLSYSRGTPVTYTTTPTTLASQGGLLINIDSATGDIARSSNGWLENNEALGWYINRAATNVSVEADTAVMLDGHKTLKLTVDASGRVKAFMYDVTGASGYNQKYMKPAKPSTKYKITCKVKTTNVATNSAFLLIEQFNSALGLATSANTTALTGTNDWTLINYEVTTSATTSYISINPHLNVAGSASDAWFGVATMTFEEVIEPVANSLNNVSPSIQSFTAVGSTDNIDQSQLTATANYPLGDLAAIYFGQQFLPRKSKLTGVVIQKHTTTGTYTGDITVAIVNNNVTVPGTTVLASYTIPNATWNALSVGVDYTVNVPCNLTVDGSTKYWIRLFSSTSSATDYAKIKAVNPTGYADGGIAYGTDGVSYPTTSTNDLYFKTLYYKPTTNFKASQNNTSISISADEDGFLEASKIDLTTATFTLPDVIHRSWSGGTLAGNSYTGNDVNKFLTAYSANSVTWSVGGTTNIISPTSSNKTDGYVIKLQGANYKTITTSIVVGNTGGTNIAGLAYSFDGTNYTEFRQINDDTEGNTTVTSTIDVTGNSEIFISLYRVSGADLRVLDYSLSGTIDTSTIPTLYNYPTNKDVTKYYTTTLGSPTTSATYRATKWGFPAIEYSATEYQFLNIDTTATGGVVQFSELGSVFTTVADGASLAITSTSTPLLWVRTNITANRLFISSNDYNASSDKDGSMKQSLVYQVIQ